MSDRPRAIVYIDGFNLYRRALSGHPELKWLDLPSPFIEEIKGIAENKSSLF